MLVRTDDFFECFAINEKDRRCGKQAAALAGAKAAGMTEIKDYEALAAITLYFNPRSIFEIGTYLGVTSDFFLGLLPECRVVSIAYPNSRWRIHGECFNNSDLPRKRIGSQIAPERRSRFTQIYGDSHKLKSRTLLYNYGRFDLVFIDGDHSRKGVAEDTRLAEDIIAETGVICWHDANPKPKYADVRQFLESELPLLAIATKDDYVGGIACWNGDIEARLTSGSMSNLEHR